MPSQVQIWEYLCPIMVSIKPFGFLWICPVTLLKRRSGPDLALPPFIPPLSVPLGVEGKRPADQVRPFIFKVRMAKSVKSGAVAFKNQLRGPAAISCINNHQSLARR